MLDLVAWRARLEELRAHNTPPFTLAERNDLVDGCRHLLWPIATGLFQYGDMQMHQQAKSREERLEWLKTGKTLTDLARVLITAYLTDGAVTSWRANDHPEVYYLVSETLAGLSPAEKVNLLRAAWNSKTKATLEPARYGELLAKVTLRR